MVTPGPVAATVPIRIDNAASRARAFSIAAWSLLPAACIALKFRCSSATSVFRAASPLLQRVEQNQQIGGPGRIERIPDSVWRTWVTIAMPSTGQRPLRAPNELRLAARPGRQSGDRSPGGQFVAAFVVIGVGSDGLTTSDGLPASAEGLAAVSPPCHAPNNLRRRAAALPKMRIRERR